MHGQDAIRVHGELQKVGQVSDVEDRIGAIRMVGKLLATSDGRKMFADNGYVSGQTIVAAHYDELIKDVLPRIHAHKAPVTVALIRDDDLFMFTIRPTQKPARRAATDADPRATIGIMYEALVQSKGRDTFRITEWDSAATAVSMPDVSRLLHA